MSLYVPAAFEADCAIGWRIVREYPFGLLLLPDGSITPIPLLDDEPNGLLRGHLARANPVSALPSGAEARVVFLGPHAYVSPTWYEAPREQVPTWNYVLVEMTGTLSWVDKAATRALLDELCARFEGDGGYTPDWVDAGEMDGMLEGIVGFRIDVRHVEPKLKLSQNRSAEDWERVRRQFAAAPPPGPALAEWMARTRR
jgi:transcriptional regulator